MGLRYHPAQGTIVCVDFDKGFVPPEMIKPRLAVVVSKAIKNRHGLCTVVPLSTTVPEPAMPYHCTLDIPFALPPRWGKIPRWVKGDMVCSVSWQRTDLLRLGKDRNGKRVYQMETLPEAELARVMSCVLHGLGLSVLTKHL